MNYLAHIFLSRGHPEIMMGNFLGDLIRNKEYRALPERLRKGVELHRKIDVFTDKHPAVLQMVTRLEPLHHKYSPVVADIFFDYLLFINWDKYSEGQLQHLADWSYGIIQENEAFIPERHLEKTRMMIRHNWLLGYGDLEQLHKVFLRVKQRSRFPDNFENAVHTLKTDMDTFNRYFNLFFPDIMEMCSDFIKNIDDTNE